MHCIFISLTTFGTSVKTYQVRRLNDSSYLVTSFPDYDYENYYRRFDAKERKENVISLSRKSSNSIDDYETTALNEVKSKNKISSSLINKARDNYFKTFYTTKKKPMNTKMCLQQKGFNFSNTVLANIKENKPVSRLYLNLEKARNLASILISGTKLDNNLKVKNKYDQIRKRSKRRIKKECTVIL